MKKVVVSFFIVIASIYSAYAQTKPYEIYFEPANVYVEGNELYMKNVRVDGNFVDGNKYTLQDSIDLTYKMDYSNMGLGVPKIVTHKGIGGYSGSFIFKDVTPDQPTFTYNGQTYNFGEYYKFTTTKQNPFKATVNLKTGHVVSIDITPSGTVKFTFTNNRGDVLESRIASTEGGLTIGIPILDDGVYTWSAESISNDAVNFQIRFFNANNRKLQTLKDGDYIDDSFVNTIWDYSKYQIYLNKGDFLQLPKPNNDLISFKLLNDKSSVVSDVGGLPLIYEAEESGYYYLAIYNSQGLGGSYSGRVSITPASGVGR